MGNISFNILGGTPSYYVTLDPDEIGGEQVYPTNPSPLTFTDIPAGTYTLTVRDANGCIQFEDNIIVL